MITDSAPNATTEAGPSPATARAPVGFWLVAAVYALVRRLPSDVAPSCRYAARPSPKSGRAGRNYTGLIVPTLALGLLGQTINQDIATLLLAAGAIAITFAAATGRRNGPITDQADPAGQSGQSGQR